MFQKKICVVGAGASGLAAIKNCVESGFKVVCFEQSDFTGGLWKYHEQDIDGVASVAKSTIINSSKELSAFSDFPPPAESPNYMHNTQMYRYFELYADRFGQRQHVVFNRKVIKCEQAPNFEKLGRWKVTTQDTRTKETFSDIFDGVMVAVGHHVKPNIPQFKGQEKFKGKIMHSHSYKKPSPYEDQTVVVVGIGNSGGDLAVELSSVAKKVYHSFRRGTWIIYRVGRNGLPLDAEFLRKVMSFFTGLWPRLRPFILEYRASSLVDHDLYHIKPNHRFDQQHVFVNDVLPSRLLAGTVVAKNGIKEFTENGVIFEGDTVETPCDTVFLATGYEVCVPFLDKTLLFNGESDVSLYKHMFPYTLGPQAHTLCLIGFVQTIGPLIPVSEIQTRYFIELMKGTKKLPSIDEMKKDVQNKAEAMAKRYYKSPRHMNQVDFVEYLEEIASDAGLKPNYWKLLVTDPVLWFHLMFGPFLSYQFRLSGPNSWDGARQAILDSDKRTKAALKTRKPDKVEVNSVSSKEESVVVLNILVVLIIFFIYFF